MRWSIDFTTANVQNELNLGQVRKTVERISENVHICANEPSLAFYRWQSNPTTNDLLFKEGLAGR